jgi:hypothetical protein
VPDHDPADLSGAGFWKKQIQVFYTHFFKKLYCTSKKHFIAVIVHSIISKQEYSNDYPPDTLFPSFELRPEGVKFNQPKNYNTQQMRIEKEG